MGKFTKCIIAFILTISLSLFSGISVFATDQQTTEGGLTEYDGSLATYDYVLKNPKLFKDYTGIKNFDLSDLNAPMQKYIGRWLESGRDKNYLISIYKFVFDEMSKNGCPIISNGDYIYFVASCWTGGRIDLKVIFSETPAIVRNGSLWVESEGTVSFDNQGGSGWSVNTSWSSGSMDGKKYYNLGNLDPFKRDSYGIGRIAVVYSIGGEIMPIFDGGGNQIINTGDLVGEKGYRVQRVLEQYSKYKTDDYPKANQLEKSSSWILDPQTAYNKDDTVLSGGKDAFRGFYFNPIKSPNGFEIKILQKRYTYHLYLWDGAKWKRKTIWSKNIMLFSGGIKKGDYVVPPKFIMQKDNFGIVYDYETKTMTAINADNAFTNGNVDNTTPYTVFSNNFYVINDDVAILYDKDTGNLGSVIYTEDNSIYDTDGSDIGKGEDVGGTVYPPGHFDPLPKPGEGAGIGEWITYFIDNIDNFFESITNGFQKLGSSIGGFFKFLASSFSFLPGEIWALLTIGIGIVIILRFLGR